MRRCGAGVLLAALALLLGAGPGLSRAGLAGGVEEAPLSDPDVQEALRFAVEAYNLVSNSLYLYRAERLVRARRQVVAGVKYILNVELVGTQCQKNGAGLGNADVSKCPLPPQSKQKKLLCELMVWNQPWLHNMQLLSHHCSVSN
ncbi:cystatin-M [Carettochelys insculpta]|uniref:cystatin-M n=1 Tax=Carettochelys insculpta TaxID=44489 RepID=UPI003EB7ADAD